MTAKAQAAQPSLGTTVREPRRGSRSALYVVGVEVADTAGWDRVPLERLPRTGTALPLHIDSGAEALGRAGPATRMPVP
ncbi:hypothetical protein [Streptomyces sp. 5-6(2022)]|uniref:hypothetical protein n=1 Tax=Streptomyces sp. 5-6(2022) TaxID=2936510 RepID=UPI0023B92F1F|nr:hypothetical protein [Streptomyces sp. 5-6(2022)]